MVSPGLRWPVVPIAGNLSFVTDSGRPYELAPAYDMGPMAFAPRSGGGLPDVLPAVRLDARVPNAVWRQAGALADGFCVRVEADARFGARFAPCVAALKQHLASAGAAMARLG